MILSSIALHKTIVQVAVLQSLFMSFAMYLNNPYVNEPKSLHQLLAQ